MATSNLLRRISIGTPCSASWEEMSGNDQVRFCDHCDLSVNDVSRMTRAKAAKMVLRSNGRLCLRLRYDPAGDLITRPVYEKLHTISRRASRIAAGAFTAVMGLSTAAYAQSTSTSVAIDREGTVSRMAVGLQAAGTYSWLVGTVTDANDAVIVGAKVTVTNERSNAAEVTETDDEGRYRILLDGDFTYTLNISSPGFSSFNQEHLALELAGETPKDVRLEVGAVGGMVMVRQYDQPLVRAASENDLVTINALLRSGADANLAEEDGTTALELAVGHGNTEVVRILLRAGADVNFTSEKGSNVLFALDDESELVLLALLLKAGANVNQAAYDGDTPLIAVAEWEAGELIRALIDAGANVNAQNNDGNSALMIAVEEGNTETVKALLAAGASYSLRNAEGEDALQLAEDHDNDEIIELLRAAGAIPAGDRTPHHD